MWAQGSADGMQGWMRSAQQARRCAGALAAPPLHTLRLQYSSTMYTWSRSAKCPWKATMLRCRRRLCRAISLSTCRHSPVSTPCTQYPYPQASSWASGQGPLWEPTGGLETLGTDGGPYLPKGAQTPDPGPPTRHHLESKHSAGGHVGQLIAAAEGTLQGGIHKLSE